jgi:hypothetical protein
MWLLSASALADSFFCYLHVLVHVWIADVNGYYPLFARMCTPNK